MLGKMEKELVEKIIGQLDGMIAAFDQAAVLSGLNPKEREACELLKDARLKLVEDMEQRYGDHWQPGWAKIDYAVEHVLKVMPDVAQKTTIRWSCFCGQALEIRRFDGAGVVHTTCGDCSRSWWVDWRTATLSHHDQSIPGLDK